jgi:hypothetical protein
VSGTIPLPVTITPADWQLIVAILMRQPYAEVHELLARLEAQTAVVFPDPTPPYQHPPPRPPE